MNSSQQGKSFNNSLQKYINSIKNTLPSLQEPFKVARNAGGIKRILPSTDEECKKFAQKYGTQEEVMKTEVNTPFGKCDYESKTNYTWDPSNKTPLPDGFFFSEDNNENNNRTTGNNNRTTGNNNRTTGGNNNRTTGNNKNTNNNNQFRQLNKKFNQDLLKYTQAFNEYNEQLIQHNYATPGSTATLLSMNNQLVKTAEQIHDSVDIMNIMDAKLKKALKEKKKQLHKSILELKEQQKKLQKIKYNNTTLDASFNDNQRMSDSTNLKYLLFLIGTLILLVTLYKLNRSL